jgi:hypothetical protein
MPSRRFRSGADNNAANARRPLDLRIAKASPPLPIRRQFPHRIAHLTDSREEGRGIAAPFLSCIA